MADGRLFNEDWRDWLIRAQPEQETRILLRGILQRNSMPRPSVFGPVWPAESFPRFANLGGIDKDGIVRTFALLDAMGQPSPAECGTVEKFQDDLRRACDKANLTDDQRREFFGVILPKWIAVDARAVLNKDDPLSPTRDIKEAM